jgi:hypothetical protein
LGSRGTGALGVDGLAFVGGAGGGAAAVSGGLMVSTAGAERDLDFSSFGLREGMSVSAGRWARKSQYNRLGWEAEEAGIVAATVNFGVGRKVLDGASDGEYM